MLAASCASDEPDGLWIRAPAPAACWGPGLLRDGRLSVSAILSTLLPAAAPAHQAGGDRDRGGQEEAPGLRRGQGKRSGGGCVAREEEKNKELRKFFDEENPEIPVEKSKSKPTMMDKMAEITKEIEKEKVIQEIVLEKINQSRYKKLRPPFPKEN